MQYSLHSIDLRCNTQYTNKYILRFNDPDNTVADITSSNNPKVFAQIAEEVHEKRTIRIRLVTYGAVKVVGVRCTPI